MKALQTQKALLDSNIACHTLALGLYQNDILDPRCNYYFNRTALHKLGSRWLNTEFSHELEIIYWPPYYFWVRGWVGFVNDSIFFKTMESNHNLSPFQKKTWMTSQPKGFLIFDRDVENPEDIWASSVHPHPSPFPSPPELPLFASCDQGDFVQQSGRLFRVTSNIIGRFSNLFIRT